MQTPTMTYSHEKPIKSLMATPMAGPKCLPHHDTRIEVSQALANAIFRDKGLTSAVVQVVLTPNRIP